MSLPESPFSCLCLHLLFSLSSALLFPSYWFIDRLLSCAVFTSVERSRGLGPRLLCLLLGVPLFLLLFLLSLPLGFFGFLFWAPLHCARRPFSYQNSVKTADLPEKILSGDRSFTFISANLCLLPDGLARFSNLRHSQRRSAAISRLLCSAPEPAGNNCEDTVPICGTEDVVPMIEMPCKTGEEEDAPFEVSVTFPKNADFVCLQEVFDGRASRKLRRCLGTTFPHILYDVGPSGPRGCGFRFFNSGLFLASRHQFTAAKYYFYPNARGEDAMASKGLLCVKVHVGMTKQKQRIVGYINCTHLHAPESDAVIRCDQMSLLLRWVLDFQSQYCEDGDLVAFDILCGDLNFDNCSTDDCMEQKHQLFSVYKDACRDTAGQDRLGTVGTLLRADSLYHEAVNTPASLKRTLDSEAERKLYVAPPLPEGIDGTGAHWTGRRIDYILYRESDSLLSLAVNKFQFITQLAGLSDHVPVSMHFSVSLPEGSSL
ncbi:PREDICTED: sphingomyelin phosphodiesterase 5-like [Nanorana parkeri]|uniref:sphingomyelin phosphodiesterase 5-like n=1 Tax=Nanorana parkeri TaxID=125878 RepID=UPI00085502E1|nr:PREDICTED: sphingomyelin phosphodiesterase 5-like [Nanorana parkeri]